MKNLLKVFAVAVAVVLAACSKDAAEPSVYTGDTQVTFTTTIPGATEGRAIADGTTVDKLYYAVYEHGATKALIAKTEPISGKTATVNVTLVSGLTYDIVFWAQKEGAPYTFNTTNNCIDIDWTNLVGNNEDRDAFIFVRKALKVEGSIQETITLKRPFAQLNIGISDFEAAKAAGFELAETKVSVDSYDQINFFGGEAYSKADGTGDYGMPAGTETPVTFACAAPMTGADETITIKGTAYKYVSMNYILPAMPTDAYDVDITFCTANEVKQYSVPTFAGVTFERNHRTNIMGSLLTDPAKFVVEIDEEFDDEDHDVVPTTFITTAAQLKEALATSGEYMLMKDLTITDGTTFTIAADKVITLDMNGHSIVAADQKASGNYELFYNLGELTITGNGTMEIEASTDRDWNALSAVIHNRGGVLTIENGTFTHKGGTDMAFVIDNSTNSYGDATTNIKGGTLKTPYRVIRNRLDTYGGNGGGNGIGTVNVSGGTLESTGNSSIWVQMSSTGGKGAVNVSGGTLIAPYALGGRNINATASDDVKITVTGGKFTNIANAAQFAVEGTVLRWVDGTYEDVALAGKYPKNITIEGSEQVIIKGMTLDLPSFTTGAELVGLTLKNVKFEEKGVYCVNVANRAPWGFVTNFTMEGCTMVGSGATNDVVGNRLFDCGGDSIGSNQFTNVAINGCTVSEAMQGIRLGALVGNCVVKGNAISKVGHNGITLRGINSNATVLVEGNTISDGGDRAFRISVVNAGATVTYKNNVITNTGDPGDGSNFKVNTNNGTITFEGNTVDGVAWNPTI